LTVAVMPVLLTVSIVVLIAGVVASQHRLPLSMPEPEHETEPLNIRWGRNAFIVLAVLAGFGLILAAASALLFVRIGGGAPAAPSGGDEPSGRQPTGAPTLGPGTTTQLTGAELRLAIVAAVVLVTVACAG